MHLPAARVCGSFYRAVRAGAQARRESSSGAAGSRECKDQLAQWLPRRCDPRMIYVGPPEMAQAPTAITRRGGGTASHVFARRCAISGTGPVISSPSAWRGEATTEFRNARGRIQWC
jgi:hypothetical protein